MAAPVVGALEEGVGTLAEDAVGGQFVGEVGTLGHAVARQLERDAEAVAALELVRRTVGALDAAPVRLRRQRRPSGETLAHHLPFR